MGVGMGATVATFSVGETVLLRTLPFAEPERAAQNVQWIISRLATYYMYRSPGKPDVRRLAEAILLCASTARGETLSVEGGQPLPTPAPVRPRSDPAARTGFQGGTMAEGRAV